MHKWEFEYRLRPWGHLAGIPKFVKLGSEVSFSGNIIDFDEDHNRYIVNVSLHLTFFDLCAI